jgi:hypothetical protein
MIRKYLELFGDFNTSYGVLLAICHFFFLNMVITCVEMLCFERSLKYIYGLTSANKT